MSSFTILINIAKHQFSLRDLGFPGPAGAWENAWNIDRVGVNTGLLTVFTNRADGLVPLTVEVSTKEPSVERALWSGVVRASLVCESGVLAVEELFGGRKECPSLAIDPVPHRALVCIGNVDSGGYDSGFGADHYRIVLWPAEHCSVWPLKRYGRVEGARQEPRISFDRSAELATSADRHHRYMGIAELARHGGERALEMIASVDGDEVDRFVATNALLLTSPVPYAALEARIKDHFPSVQKAVLGVLHRAVLDFEFGDIPSLDVDTVYRIVSKSSSDRSLKVFKEDLLAALDVVAEIAREVSPSLPSPPQAPPLLKPARRLVALFLQQGLLAATGEFDFEQAADALTALLAISLDEGEKTGGRVAALLLEQPGVEDVFGDDEQIEAMVKKALS